MNLLSFAGVLSTGFSILLAIIILLIMITVHELGHYLVGKLFKFKINEFAIGMGPAIFKRKKKNSDEVFSIRAFPLGGFCAFEGEDEESDTDGAFNKKEPWKRILVLIAGATMNLITGLIVLTLSVGIYGQLLVKTYDIKPITDAQYIGYSLQNDDVILKINDKNMFLSTDFIEVLAGKKKGEVVTVTVLANGEKQNRKVRLRCDVSSKNISDVVGVYSALGVSTIERVDDGDSDLKGKYLLRINDADNYDNCTRIFSISELVSYAKTFSSGQTLSFYYSGGGSEKLLKTIEFTSWFLVKYAPI